MLKIANRGYRGIEALFAGMMVRVEWLLFGVLRAAGGVSLTAQRSLMEIKENPPEINLTGFFGI